MDHRHVKPASGLVFAAADLPDLLGRQTQKVSQCGDPLVEQLAAVNDHERVHLALRNQIGADDGLAESRRSRQDARVMPQQSVGSLLLLPTQGAKEGERSALGT